jgi:hypothetical protein
MSEKVNSQTTTVAETSAPVITNIAVTVKLKLVDELSTGGTAVARSALSKEGERRIRISLNRVHLLVSKALLRADSLLIRFLVSLSLTEFCWAWRQSNDFRAVERALKQIAGMDEESKIFGTGFTSALAASDTLRVIDSLPIFGRSDEVGPFKLFDFTAPLSTPSNILGWREGVAGSPLPPQQPQPKAVVAPQPVVIDPFLASFHKHAGELLDSETFEALTELAKGEPANA